MGIALAEYDSLAPAIPWHTADADGEQLTLNETAPLVSTVVQLPELVPLLPFVTTGSPNPSSHVHEPEPWPHKYVAVDCCTITAACGAGSTVRFPLFGCQVNVAVIAPPH
jgi:hypothetical protein